MSSLLSKIFGSRKKNIALLYLNDSRAEAAQVSGDLKMPNLLGLNKIGFSKGMVENGEVKTHSQVQNILKDLFAGAEPQPISTGKMYVAIPFDQLYPFIRVFSKSVDEGRLKSDMDEALFSEIPFPREEVDVIGDTKIEGAKLIASAVAVPKNWKSGIKHILAESGFIDLEFIPEPYAQISLSGISDPGNTILFSFVGSRIYVSVFYAGFLYDSYLCKNGESAGALLTEYQNVNKDFKNSFSKNIENICFADAPNKIAGQIQKIFSKEEANIIFIRPENRFFADFLDSGYSTSLAGLANKVFEG
jgi:hypothetical protein